MVFEIRLEMGIEVEMELEIESGIGMEMGMRRRCYRLNPDAIWRVRAPP